MKFIVFKAETLPILKYFWQIQLFVQDSDSFGIMVAKARKEGRKEAQARV